MTHDEINVALVLATWTAANLGTGLAYFHLPYEMWHWIRYRRLRGLSYIVGGFCWFILACGVHHIYMAIVNRHHPSMTDALIDLNMFFASVVVSISVYRHRLDIISVLDLIEDRLKT